MRSFSGVVSLSVLHYLQLVSGASTVSKGEISVSNGGSSVSKGESRRALNTVLFLTSHVEFLTSRESRFRLDVEREELRPKSKP